MCFLFFFSTFPHSGKAKAYELIMAKKIISVIHMTFLALLLNELQRKTWTNMEKE